MIPVEGHKHLYREESGAIVNTDTNGYANYMKAKNKKLTEKIEIEDLRNEIDELKNQLRQLLDRDGKEKDQYLQEPEVMKFFKDNDNKITSTTEGPSGVQTKTFTNKFLNKSAVNAPKGVFPKG